MIGKIKRSTRIAASYVNVLGDLVVAEAREEMERTAERVKQKVFAVALLLFSFVWLNIGAVVLILDSPYRRWAPFAVAVGVGVVALMVWFHSNSLANRKAFAGVRRALAEDAKTWNIDLLPSHVLADLEKHADAAKRRAADASRGNPAQAAGAAVDAAVEAVKEKAKDLRDAVDAPPPPKPSAAELEAQLRDLRVALKVTTAGPWFSWWPFGSAPSAPTSSSESRRAGPGAPHDYASGRGFSAGFHPKSRTMQTVMALVGDGRSGSLFDRWPVRVAGALIASRVFKRRGKWLIGAWPVLKLVIGAVAQSRGSTPRASSFYRPSPSSAPGTSSVSPMGSASSTPPVSPSSAPAAASPAPASSPWPPTGATVAPSAGADVGAGRPSTTDADRSPDTRSSGADTPAAPVQAPRTPPR